MKKHLKPSPKHPYSHPNLEALDTSLIIVKDIQNLISSDRVKHNENLQFSLSFYNLDPISQPNEAKKPQKEGSPPQNTPKPLEKDVSPVFFYFQCWRKKNLNFFFYFKSCSSSEKDKTHPMPQGSGGRRAVELESKTRKACNFFSRNIKKAPWTKVLLGGGAF